MSLLVVLSGCATLTEQEKQDKSTTIDVLVQQTIKKIIYKNPDMTSEFEAAPGYAILKLDTAKVPYVGYGNGKGILVDNLNKERFYLKAKINAVGSGLGAESFRIILLFENEKAVQKFKSGKIRFGARADVAAKTGDKEGVRIEGKKTIQKGFSVYVFNDAGVAATMTIWMLNISLDRNLN